MDDTGSRRNSTPATKAILQVTSILVLATVPLLLGNGRSTVNLYGSWKLDADKQLADNRQTQRYKQNPDTNEKVLKGFIPTMGFQFSDGKMAISSDNVTTSLEVSITSQKDKLEAQDKQAGDRYSITWIDDNHIRVMPTLVSDTRMVDADFINAFKGNQPGTPRSRLKFILFTSKGTLYLVRR